MSLFNSSFVIRSPLLSSVSLCLSLSLSYHHSLSDVPNFLSGSLNNIEGLHGMFTIFYAQLWKGPYSSHRINLPRFSLLLDWFYLFVF